MTDTSAESTRAEVIITKGAQLAGAVAGGALGALGGGPLGAGAAGAAGWAVGEVVARVGFEVMERFSGRGTERAAAAALLIAQEGVDRESQGERPRDDGFFDERGALRPEEQELLEAVLLSAANTYEEKKLPYLTRIFNGVKYDASVKTPDALFLARTAEQLTYRQLVALAVIGRPEEHELKLANAHVAQESGDMTRLPPLMDELDDLGTRGLVGLISPDDDRPRPASSFLGSSGLSDHAYTRDRLTDSGRGLFGLMGLADVPLEEREQWITELAGVPIGADL